MTFSATISLSIRLNDEFIFLNDDISRTCEATFEALIYPEESNELDLRLEFDGISYNLNTPINCQDENHTLRINQWEKNAPPRVYFDGDQINRGIGLHLSQTNEFTLCDLTSHMVFFINSDAQNTEFSEPVDLYIDDKLIEEQEFDWIHRNVPVEHSARLTLGCHRIVVVSRRRRWTILDTDIVVDGVNDVKVLWSNANLSFADVEIIYGSETVFLQNREIIDYLETAAKFGMSRNRRIVIDGIKVPDGLDKYLERIKNSKRFSELMIKNFKAFLDLKKKIKEKKRDNKKLTAEETVVDNISDYQELDNWISKRKKKEGYSTSLGGTTGFGGGIKFLGPKPKNAFDELIKIMTLKIHEPSHAAGFEKKALSLGLDLKKINQHIKVLAKIKKAINKGKSVNKAISELSKKERKCFIWGYRKNKVKLEKYFALCNNLIDSALEEIQEYEAEVNFFNELLKKLQEEQDKKVKLKVPERYLKKVIQYFHSIREFFKDLSDDEKKRMRKQLNELKEQVDKSTKLDKDEKEKLNKLLDEALDALK